MATNVNDQSPDFLAKVLDWVESQPAEIRSKLPPEDSDDWFAAASEMMLLATSGGETEDESNKGPRTRRAVHYTVLLLSDGYINEDGEVVKPAHTITEVVGSGLGPVGREPLDPKKQSAAKKIHTRAQLSVIKLQRKGIQAGLMMVPTKELPSFFGVEVQEQEQASEEQAATA